MWDTAATTAARHTGTLAHLEVRVYFRDLLEPLVAGAARRDRVQNLLACPFIVAAGHRPAGATGVDHARRVAGGAGETAGMPSGTAAAALSAAVATWERDTDGERLDGVGCEGRCCHGQHERCGHARGTTTRQTQPPRRPGLLRRVITTGTAVHVFTAHFSDKIRGRRHVCRHARGGRTVRVEGCAAHQVAHTTYQLNCGQCVTQVWCCREEGRPARA